MKQKMLVLAAVFFAVTAIEGHALGVGIQFNGNYSSNLVSYGASLLISPNTHSHWAIDWYVGDVLSLGTSFDYWFFTPSVAYLGSGSLHFYLGVGAFAWLTMWDDGMGFGIGPRVPIGLDLAFSVFDIYLQVVPQFGVELLPGFGIGGLRPAVNLGFRFWIDGHSGL